MSTRDQLRIFTARAQRWMRDRGVPFGGRAAVVYHPQYLAFPQEAGTRCSFDTRRPLHILEALQQAGVLAGRDVLTPRPVPLALISRVHSDGLLQRIGDEAQLASLLHLDPTTLPRGQGRLLEPFLWQTGGSVLAVERALAEGRPMINLGGGFHHAERDHVGGFCPVNDIAIAIEAARRGGRVRRVLVIDLDFHQGSGTAAIFAQDEEVFTLSLHGQSWVDAPQKENHIDVLLPADTCDGGYLRALDGALGEVDRRFRPELAIYVAGADAHEDDRRGGFA
ncbi:MAG: hypothetical protein JRH20_24245, partial [Deltaproteobacteria bacterium]|nr:hypothetical protein [Deltaproteobacteria bacterium]